MARLLIDLDDTITDHLGKLLHTLTIRFQKPFSMDDLKTWCVWECLGIPDRDVKQIWLTPGFFLDVKPLPGALQALTRLHAVGHDILIVTASPPIALVDKERWLAEHLPWFSHENLIACHRKELIPGDVMFDDGPHNLEKWKAAHPGGVAICMDRPYNRHVKGVIRVSSWAEFERCLPDRIRG